MPDAIAAVLYKVFVAFGASVEGAALYSTAIASIVTGATAQTLATIAITSSIARANMPDFKANVDRRREVLIRSAIEARSIIYGKVLHAGVLTYANVAGNDNRDMWIAVTHAGHEVNDILEVWYDDNQIAEADVSWGGGVTGGDYYIGGTAYVHLYRNLGTSTQTVISAFDSTFADITTEHRGRGTAYTVHRLKLEEASEKVFSTGAPSTIRALIEGKKCYDPRLDVSYGASPDNASYIAYTDNPILIIADYMRDALGLNVANAKIDWTTVAEEADFCDQLVPNSTADTTEKRFTCNTVLITADTHASNLRELLTSCNGRMAYRSGKWSIHAGRFGTGANLVSNGEVTSNITGWTVGDAGTGSVAWNSGSGGRLEITNTSGNTTAIQAVTTVVGNAYCYKANTTTSSGTDSGDYLLAKSDSADGTSPDVTNNKLTEDAVLELEFIATATTTYFVLENNGATSTTAGFSDMEMYLVADRVVTADYLRDDMGIRTTLPKEDRFNSARAFYMSAAEEYKFVQSLEVENTAFISRDNDEILFNEFRMGCTDSEDEAQRILHKLIQLTDGQTVVNMPCNFKALDIAIGDRVMVTIADGVAWTNKIFRCINWRLIGNDGGIDLVLREDSHDSWEDPDSADYSTRTATGAIAKATPEVPDPTSVTLTARTDLPDMLISWVNPTNTIYWDLAEVWRGTTSTFASATLLGKTRGDRWLDSSQVITSNYYYWVRLTKGAEVSNEVATSPTNATAANIAAATASSVPWTGVIDDDGHIPADDATVGGTFGTDIIDENSGVVNDLDALNTFVLTNGGVGLNYNAFCDIARPDGTPAGYYIGQQTGGPAARTDLIAFEDSTNKVLKINSGSPLPLILTTAVPIDSGSQYQVVIRAKAGAATTLNIHMFTFSAISLGTDIITFCTSPSGNESEVATASREHTLGGAVTMNLTTSFAAQNSNFLFPWLDSGNDVGTTYAHRWVCFGFQRDSGATDTDIYIDTAMLWKEGGMAFTNAGAP